VRSRIGRTQSEIGLIHRDDAAATAAGAGAGAGDDRRLLVAASKNWLAK